MRPTRVPPHPIGPATGTERLRPEPDWLRRTGVTSVAVRCRVPPFEGGKPTLTALPGPTPITPSGVRRPPSPPFGRLHVRGAGVRHPEPVRVRPPPRPGPTGAGTAPAPTFSGPGRPPPLRSRPPRKRRTHRRPNGPPSADSVRADGGGNPGRLRTAHTTSATCTVAQQTHSGHIDRIRPHRSLPPRPDHGRASRDAIIRRHQDGYFMIQLYSHSRSVTWKPSVRLVHRT